MNNDIAGPGQVFVCSCCFKRSRDRNGEQKIDAGWDTSCRTHAVLCNADTLVTDKNGFIIKATAAGCDRIQ